MSCCRFPSAGDGAYYQAGSVAASPATNTFSANCGCWGLRKPMARSTRSASMSSSIFPVGFHDRAAAVRWEATPPLPLPHRNLAVFADKPGGGEGPSAAAPFFVAAGGFQYDGQLRPWGGRILSYGRLGHDFNLGDADGTLAIAGAYAVARYRRRR